MNADPHEETIRYAILSTHTLALNRRRALAALDALVKERDKAAEAFEGAREAHEEVCVIRDRLAVRLAELEAALPVVEQALVDAHQVVCDVAAAALAASPSEETKP